MSSERRHFKKPVLTATVGGEGVRNTVGVLLVLEWLLLLMREHG